MTLELFNHIDPFTAREELHRCCGATRWVDWMLAQRPFADEAQLYLRAAEIWAQCTREDYLEAFGRHPKIGDISSLEKKFASTKEWSAGEQAGVNTASGETIKALAKGNKAYEEKFGYIFIVCATGKSAAEMLALLQARLPNNLETEFRIAAAEQAKITRIRLEKMLSK